MLPHVLEQQLDHRLALAAAHGEGALAARPHAHHRRHEREDLVALVLGHDPGEGGEQLRLGGGLVVVGDARPALEQVDEGMEAEPVADGERAPLEHRHVTRRLEPQELGEEPRLAEAGLADDADDAPASVRETTHAVRERRQLRVAPDHRRRHGPRRPGARARRAVELLPGGAQREHRLRIRLALEPQRLEGLELELGGGRPMRLGADPDVAVAGRFPESGRQVHGVAHHGEAALRASADLSGDDQASVDPDLQRERGRQDRADLGVLLEGGEPSPEVDGRVQRLARGVLDGVGHAEERHEAFADVLVDDPAVAPHPRRQLGEAAVEQRLQAFRRQGVVERGEPADVGEQHGRLAALARTHDGPAGRERGVERASGDGIAARRQHLCRLGAVREGVAGLGGGAGADEDAARLARGGEPLGQAYRLAHHPGASPRRVADAARDDGAGGDADVQVERGQASLRSAHPAHRRAHRERRSDAAVRAVASHLAETEDGQHAVADVLLDGAAVRGDDVLDRCQAAVDQLGDGFGVEGLGERGEAGDVGHDHGRVVPRLSAWTSVRTHARNATSMPEPLRSGKARPAGRAISSPRSRPSP